MSSGRLGLRLSSLAFAWFAVLSALVACSKPAPPTIVPQRASVTGIDPVGITLDVVLGATNPNATDLTVSAVTAHVVLAGDHDVGTVTVPDVVTLPAGQTTTMHVSVALKWADLGALVPFTFTGADVPYTVDGTLALGGMFGSLGVPFQIQGAIPRDQILRASMQSIPGFH